ncbi:hypothetical protein ACKVMT_13985 [Halobacteriales archaeon Cl-PHB]
MSTVRLSPSTYRLVLVAAIGLVGCAIAVVATTPAEPVTTRKLLGLGFGLLLAFVGLSGVLDALRR